MKAALIKSRFKFPHFPRTNPEWVTKFLKSCLYLLLFALIATNLLQPQLFTSDLEKKLRLEAMSNPAKSKPHESLGEYYLKYNTQAAEREYLLAEELYQDYSTPDSASLGIESSPWQRFLGFRQKEELLKNDLDYWGLVSEKSSHYQYALVKMAALYYQLGDKLKSRQYLETALDQNPTNVTAITLYQKIK